MGEQGRRRKKCRDPVNIFPHHTSVLGLVSPGTQYNILRTEVTQRLVGKVRAQRNFSPGWLVGVMVKESQGEHMQAKVKCNITVIDAIANLVDMFQVIVPEV